MPNDDKLPEGIVIKLFDQVKHSSDQNTEQIKDIRDVTNELIKLIENRPDPETMEDAYRSIGVVKSCVEGIKTAVDRLSSRVGLMIATVLITFTVLSFALAILSFMWPKIP